MNSLQRKTWLLRIGSQPKPFHSKVIAIWYLENNGRTVDYAKDVG
jgi:hypothetical protein